MEQPQVSTEVSFRRILPRQFTDWRGRYMIEGDPQECWRECRVVDISSAGAGLELIDATPEETEGKHIILDVQLKGQVRHVREGSRDELRVGMQFVELTDPEHAYLKFLAELDGRW